MECRKICRDVPALLDGELHPRRKMEVLRHLDSCGACADTRIEFEALRRTSKEVLSYRGTPLSFSDIRCRISAIEPLEQVIRYQLPKLKIPGTAPRFAVAMVLLVSVAGMSYALRHTRQVYVAVKSPFAYQEETLNAAMDEGRFPWDEELPGKEAESRREKA